MLNTMTLTPALPADHWVVEPYVGLATNQHMSAPKSAAQGTTVSAAGQTADRTRAFIGLDVVANPGSPPREAPV